MRKEYGRAFLRIALLLACVAPFFIGSFAEVTVSRGDRNVRSLSAPRAPLLATQPTISNLSDQVADEGVPTLAIPMLVADPLGTVLSVSVTSSDQDLLPETHIILTGIGGNRFIQLFPTIGLTGASTVTVTIASPDGRTTQQSFVLTVRPRAPGIRLDPVSQTVRTGQDAFFEVIASGTGPLGYQWQMNSLELSGEINASLLLRNLNVPQFADLRVIVRNSGGSVTSQVARLVVQEVPVILEQPVSQTLQPGETLNLTVGPNGAGPFVYQWRLNGENIPAATNSSFIKTDRQVFDSGVYSVVVGGGFGAASSVPATVTVFADSLELADEFQNRIRLNTLEGIGRGYNRGASKEPGEPNHADELGGASVWVSWMAPASGIATVQTLGSIVDTVLAIYQGTNVAQLTRLARDDDSDDFFASVVQFNAVSNEVYEIAIDGFGGKEGDIVLSWDLFPTTGTVPIILSHPSDWTVRVGENVTFAVIATNPPPGIEALTYQWLFDDVPIPGQTNSLINLTNVGVADVGEYDARVSTSSATVTSKDGHLRLNLADGVGSTDPIASKDKFGTLVTSSAPVLARSLGRAHSEPGVMTAPSRGFSGAQVFSTFRSKTEAGEPLHCGVIGGASHWFSYHADSDAWLRVSTEGSDFDTVLAVYTGPGTDFASLQLVACDNDSGADGKTSRVFVEILQGTTYYVAVDGVNGVTGDVQFAYDLLSPPQLDSERNGDGSWTLRLSGLEGSKFAVEWSADLIHWAPFARTNLVAPTLRLTDDAAAYFPMRWYRALSD